MKKRARRPELLTQVNACRGIVEPRLRPARAHLRRGFVTPPTYVVRRSPPSHWDLYGQTVRKRVCGFPSLLILNGRIHYRLAIPVMWRIDCIQNSVSGLVSKTK